MPEGDTLRRLATRITEQFAGDRVERSTMRDPRLVGVDLAGTTLVDADAYGKHLFIRFDDGRSLHAHLLMTGSFAVGRTSREPEWKRRILEAPRVERVEALGEYGVTLKILGSVRATEQWAARGEFRKRLLAALQANGIEIPRPQRVVLHQDPGGIGDPLTAAGLGAGPDQEDLAEGTE